MAIRFSSIATVLRAAFGRRGSQQDSGGRDDAPNTDERSRSDASRVSVGLLEKVTAVIPAHNEADVISDTIQAVLDMPEVSQLIVVDDGSSDNTGEVARAAGAHQVLLLKRNLGKGGALNAAWPIVTGDVVLLIDADLGGSASEGVRLLEPVLRDDADMAVAILGRSAPIHTGDSQDGVPALAAKSGGFGMVMKTARLGIRVLTGTSVQSPLAGPRAMRREIVDRAGGFAAKFGVEVGLTVDALRMGYRVVEVPVGMVHRASGRDLRGFAHRGKQMADVLRTLGRKALMR